MVDSGIAHDVESRLRNIEAHLGIGNVDEETGEYTVDQHEPPAPPEEGGGEHPEGPDEHEQGV